jgi:hypothetical protein
MEEAKRINRALSYFLVNFAGRQLAMASIGDCPRHHSARTDPLLASPGWFPADSHQR